ncbi:MAG TPA: prepilin-type N-terminal cleavage/methylation domain-containing protein [Candidatus Angelobacter sp.]|jgi:prepilin-type N-terminal cleavage/methylation domain-containing protein
MKRPFNRISAKVVASRAARGFSLIELLISVFILAIVSGAVFQQINLMQKKSSSEAMKVDMNQQAREFVDQTVHDLHMEGYPSASMYSNPPLPSMMAAGLVSVSPTQILLEGDVNNDGRVYSVNIFYKANDPLDPTCPCIRRSAQPKINADSLNQGIYAQYTETQHVFPPGTDPGESGEDLFAYYDQNGNPVNVGTGVDISTPAVTNALSGTNTPSGKDLIATIKTVKINLSLLSQPNPESKGLIRTSISATARLNQ